MVLIVVLLPRTRGALVAFLRTFKSLKGPGVELSLSDPVTSQSAGLEVQRLRHEASELIAQQVRRRHFDTELLKIASSAAVSEHLSTVAGAEPLDWRCTIYVRDPLFEDTLVQLVDYKPRGSGAGRRKSIRFGIVAGPGAWARPSRVRQCLTMRSEKLRRGG